MIKVFVNSDSRYRVETTFVRTTVYNLLKKKGVKGKVEVEVSIVGDRRMTELNKNFRHQNETTDVLSFPLEDVSFQTNQKIKGFINPPDDVLRLGDVVVSYPQAADEAAFRGVMVEEELKDLIEHGVLHLLGIHHE